LLVPFHFTQEKPALDYFTGLSRYQFLRHLSEFAELETLAFLEEGEETEVADFDEVRVRKIDVPKSSALVPPWYALDGYDGILLLSQFLTDDLLYYRVPDVPVVHCIEGAQRLQHVLLRTLLRISAFQRSKDTLVVKASWMQEWLAELGVPTENVRVIPDGIDVVAPIGDKALAKQHTAAIFEKPMFTKRPVVGLISGFEPDCGAAWISTFARANPHLAIFVYDAMLAKYYRHPPENVVIFSADNVETRSVLPIFFQALDLVCFPAMPGTPLSIVLEAMAYGAPCVAMTKYGMPAEVAGAGVAVKSNWDHFGNFHVPMAELSRTIQKWLQPSEVHGLYENFTERIVHRHTRKDAARMLVAVFEESLQRETEDFRTERTLFPPIFCRRYEPDTGTLKSYVYRMGTNRYNRLETALTEVLAERHTPAEVESVFKHFQREYSTPTCETNRAGNGFPENHKEINQAGEEHQQKGEKHK
jgi:glycosyltransferase involved in cell wall biosynthesis